MINTEWKAPNGSVIRIVQWNAILLQGVAVLLLGEGRVSNHLEIKQEDLEGWTMVTEDKDPSGMCLHEAGAKGDAGKPKMDLLPMEAVMEIAKVMTYGAEKYTENGWRQVPEGDKRYKAALLRHMAKEEFEELDSDTDLSHIAHEACNALFRLQFYLDSKRFRETSTDK